MPTNPYDFSHVSDKSTNALIDQTLAELRLMDKESKIRLAIYKAIRLHAERVGVLAIDIPDLEFLIETLASDIAQVI